MIKGAIQTSQIPRKPSRDVQTAFLRGLKDAVVVVALNPCLGRHGVKALCTILRSCQHQVRYCSCNTSIPILERMDGHKPEMGDRGFENEVDSGVVLEPVEEDGHFRFQPSRLRCLIM